MWKVKITLVSPPEGEGTRGGLIAGLITSVPGYLNVCGSNCASVSVL